MGKVTFFLIPTWYSLKKNFSNSKNKSCVNTAHHLTAPVDLLKE